MRKTKTSYEKSRIKELLWLLIQTHQPNCHICDKPFKKEDILPSRGVDQLTEHHKDHNHHNSELENRVLTHRSCHKAHHTAQNIHFWRNFK